MCLNSVVNDFVDKHGHFGFNVFQNPPGALRGLFEEPSGGLLQRTVVRVRSMTVS